MNGCADGIAVGVLGQVVDIDSGYLAVVKQTKPMGNQDHSLTDLFADFQLAGRPSGLGGHLYFLAVDQTL